MKERQHMKNELNYTDIAKLLDDMIVESKGSWNSSNKDGWLRYRDELESLKLYLRSNYSDFGFDVKFEEKIQHRINSFKGLLIDEYQDDRITMFDVLRRQNLQWHILALIDVQQRVDMLKMYREDILPLTDHRH